MSQALKHSAREPSSIDTMVSYIYEYRDVIAQLKKEFPQVHEALVKGGYIRRLAD